MKFLGSLLLLLSAVGHAQVFPVRGNLQIAPPYSPLLTDYTALGTQKLSLVTLKGAAKNSTVGRQKAAIEEKLPESGGLQGERRSAAVVQPAEKDGGEFWVKAMNGMEWLHTIGNLGSSVWETAALPKGYWNRDDSKYDASTIHLPPTLAGVSDAAVEKVTEYQQLVKLGYDVAAKEEVREGLWNAVKNISPDNIKKAFENFYEEKKANYTSNKKHIVRHTAGKDAVTVTFAVWGAVAAITNAVKKTGEVIGEKVAKRVPLNRLNHIFGKPEHA